jgi:hypothetical protein
MAKETTVVSQIPSCDLCGGSGVKKPAYADANLGRGWANVCREHFVQHGCRLGTGRGQRLILRGTENDA